MTPDFVFSFVNMLAIPMWILMIILPNWKVTRLLINLKIIPIILAVIYAIYIVQALLSGGGMDFGSLDSVMALFTSKEAVLAGWIHYLVFDLVVGMWILDKNREVGIHPLLMAPCLIGTLMFGPIGFLLFMIMKAIKQKGNKSI